MFDDGFTVELKRFDAIGEWCLKMAIGRSIRPLVIVAGTVERTRELVAKKGDNAGKVYGYEVVLKLSNDAVAGFTMYSRAAEQYGVPAVGEYLAVECSVEESREYGTSLGFERPAFDALDLIQSKLSGSAA